VLGAFALSLDHSFAKADDQAPATDPPSPLAVKVEHRVQEGLVKPLADQEANTSRFSRMRPPPHESRVRVTQTTETLDKAGRPFVAFAVDARFGADWHENDIVGCAYTKTGELFVKRGDGYRPASFLLGKNADPVSGVCEPRT
jgi:hypothetical protein